MSNHAKIFYAAEVKTVGKNDKQFFSLHTFTDENLRDNWLAHSVESQNSTIVKFARRSLTQSEFEELQNDSSVRKGSIVKHSVLPPELRVKRVEKPVKDEPIVEKAERSAPETTSEPFEIDREDNGRFAAPKRIMRVEDGVIFDSMRQAALASGFDKRNTKQISKCCKDESGKSTAAGYHWKFVE